MGCTYSYLKLCSPPGSRVLGIIFGKGGLYKKYVLTASCSGVEKTSEYVNYDYYYNYGHWYYYNGNTNVLEDILSTFDPKKMDLLEFTENLKTTCNFQAYESTFQIIGRWAYTAISLVGSLVPIANATFFTMKLLGN